MADHSELESLYGKAKSALKARDYDRASDLLRQILLVDEDYKDASRLLAQAVKLKRRRWYNDPRLWSVVGVSILVGLGIYFFPKLQGLYNQAAPAPLILPTDTLVPTMAPTDTATAAATLPPTPTPVPLTWKRLSIGGEFPRDTVIAFATDRNDPDVIYAAMENAGVYKTIDGGLSWRPAHHGLANTQVRSLLIEPQNSKILYAGTLDGIYKTEDGGENWARIGDGIYLLMDYQESSHLYARDENNIYETTDQGLNWEAVHSTNANCPRTILSWAIHPAEGDTLFAGGGEGCESGLYQSTDGGRRWTLIEMGGDYNVDELAIGLDESGNPSIYLHLDGDYFPGPPYDNDVVSHDGGNTWISEGTKFDLLATDPDYLSVIYSGGTSGLFTTRGKGYPWRGIGLRTVAPSAIHIDHINGTDRIIVGGSRFSTNHDDGIFISTDGGNSWNNYMSGVGSTRAELKPDPIDNSRMYLATYYLTFYSSCTLYRSLDTGRSWSEIYHVADWCGPTFDGANDLFLIDRDSWQKSEDGGSHWWWGLEQNPIVYGAWNELFRLPTVSQSISANPYTAGFIHAIGDEIYYSEDGGRTWQESIGFVGLGDARLFHMDQGQTVYAIGRDHQSYSTDSGRTWQSCGADVTAARSDSRLALDPKGSHLYLATPGQGVMVSSDSCQSWQSSNEGLTNLFVNTLALDPENPEIVYAGTDGGAYISYDAGATWNQINDGLLGATVVYSIVVDKEGNVYAATPYGIFKLEGK